MSAPSENSWVMWEARAVDGRTAELMAWVLEIAAEPAQVYSSANRVVAIYPVNVSDISRALTAPPAHLLARPAYQWEFERVR